MSSTMVNAFINNATGIAAGDSKIANISAGAQLGLGARLTLLDAATPLAFSPAVVIVTHTPTMFKDIQYADAILKTLVERHAKSITGIDFGYTLEQQETPAGHDGQQLKMPTHSKRTDVSPSMVFQEINGNLVWQFHRRWMSLIRDPDTNASAMAAWDTDDLSPQLLSSFSMDIAVIQFDPTMRPENIIDAAMITGMWPTETGNFGFQREIGTTQLQERTIPYTGVVQHNDNTRTAAQNIAKVLNLHKANFNVAPPIAEQIEDRLGDKGISAEIEEVMADFQSA